MEDKKWEIMQELAKLNDVEEIIGNKLRSNQPKLFDEDFKKGRGFVRESGGVKDSFVDMVYIVKDIQAKLIEYKWELNREKAINVNKMIWEVIEKLDSIKEEITKRKEEK